MNATYTSDQNELRELVRSFLCARSPVRATRDLVEAGEDWDSQVWQQLASQLGVVGLGIPETYGGNGLGPMELAIVVEEMGRVLYNGPYVATAVLAASLLGASDDSAACARWLPRMASGELTVSVILDDGADSDSDSVLASSAGSDWTLNGSASYVANGTTADLFLVVARDEDGYVAIFAAEADTAGVEAEVLPLLDLTRSYAAVSFRHAGVQRLIVEDPAPLIARIEALALVAVAAEQVGGATQILDDAIEYAKLRVQFGRPIGSFQAIKHRCADLFVQIEGARSAAFFAAAMLQDDDPEAVLAASVAKAWCSEAFTAAAKAAVQIFGGIGFTWEHDCHLYLRRAKTDELLNGTPAEHRHKIAALVGL